MGVVVFDVLGWNARNEVQILVVSVQFIGFVVVLQDLGIEMMKKNKRVIRFDG